MITPTRHPDGTCEVLEVKCHSPFIENRYNYYNNSSSSSSNGNNSNSSSDNRINASYGSSTGGRGGRGGRGAGGAGRGGGGRGDDRDREGLSISDRGPADSVATWHIPQLQLHILCAGKALINLKIIMIAKCKIRLFY